MVRHGAVLMPLSRGVCACVMVYAVFKERGRDTEDRTVETGIFIAPPYTYFFGRFYTLFRAIF